MADIIIWYKIAGDETPRAAGTATVGLANEFAIDATVGTDGPGNDIW